MVAIQGALCGNLQAQSADTVRSASKDTLKNHHLKEVAIRAGRISSRNTSATPLQILKGAELEKLNSFSVADAIRFFSGVQLKDYGGIGGLKTINVRSLGSNHLAVFYDGVEFGNSQNGQVDLGKFSLDNIEEIALYNAQKGTIFQPAKGFSAGSAIYLTSRHPNFEPGSNSIGKISLKTGSSGLINPSFFWQYKLSDNVYSTVSTEIIHANGRYKFTYTNGVYDTTAVRQNGDITAQRVELGLNGKLRDSSKWAVKGYLYNSDRGLPAAIVSNKFDSNERLWDRDIFVQSSYNKKFSDQYSLMMSAKYANTYSHYVNPDITTTTGLLNDRYYEDELYFSVANKYRINPFWDVDLSADYQWNTLHITENDSAKYRFVPPVRNTLLTALATELHFKRLNIQANVLGTFVKDKVPILSNADNTTEYTPAVLFSWQPTDNPDFRLRGFYKSIFRLPTFNDLYYTFVGYAAVKPEFNKQYDVGFTYNKTLHQQTLVYFAVQTDVYYNHVRDKIVAVPGADLGRWSIINLGKVHIQGIDVNAQATWQVLQDVFINTGIAYTHQKSVDVTNPNDLFYNQQIAYTPVNNGSVLIGGEWRKWYFTYSYIYTGERYSQKYHEVSNYLPPWYTHDAGFTYTTNYNKHKLKLTAEINNLLNQTYDVIFNFPLPGRNYRFTISSTF
ncbi:TonB-dependent receptor plug domain-containing protein [Mucilaginibacter sp. SP1R1]|uniref:TonB-dependent receptor plug domain-containing protein n=1 Tax=Mucilaginibacter sp. SP1R1 TaxID=2723091 RepID=UPI00161E16FC|nr:TonB-dependent receptor [Mucilaginibacter sp. SP1R1]MBB6149886.1 outer membrane cobalamin receptor [Mucilaginibacter sp. SP1R1]